MDGAGTEDTATRKPDPRDGSVQFDHYSLEQLRELQLVIDPQSFPENHRRLMAALAAREAALQAQPVVDDGQIAGRFTERGGILGWLQARWRRSPLYGRGLIGVSEEAVTLSGLGRNWLLMPVERVLSRDLSRVVNVVADGGAVQFAIRGRFLANLVRFRPDNPQQLPPLVELLPKTQTRNFLEHWRSIQNFTQRLNAISGIPWVTPLIVVVNLLIFACMAVVARSLGTFLAPQLVTWGGNFGPLTVSGQWWRLVTAIFVHANLAHVLLNMWAFWTVGRWTERLYGRFTFAFIYLSTGALASLSSILWDPSLASVGASGAIFGVFGAFLATPLRLRGQIPASILRSWWPSTLLFVAFNLWNGAMTPGIDNAAHVGGLLSGVILGLILARPLEREATHKPVVARVGVALVCIAFLVGLTLWQVMGIGAGPTTPERFFQRHPEFAKDESNNLATWNTLIAQARNGIISNAEVASTLEQQVLPFWEKNADIAKSDAKLPAADVAFAHLIESYARARRDWARELIEVAKSGSGRGSEDLENKAKATLILNAQIERIGIRARMEHRPRALANSAPVSLLRQLLARNYQHCAKGPPFEGRVLKPSDAKDDTPSLSYEIGCETQRLFMQGRYQRLEELMNERENNLEDLPDGSSSYSAMVHGLNALFRYGHIDPEVAFGHTADWRRAVKNSVMAELVEADAFSEWAWGARGGGYANTISEQNNLLYFMRTQMAAAALEEIKERARDNPLWNDLMINVGVDLSKDRGELREIFEKGYKRDKHYWPLYRAMLRALMPRWGGSYEDVDAFIVSVDARADAAMGHELYASLYSIYSWLEGDEEKFFEVTQAGWGTMQAGFEDLLKRYPHSDYLLSTYASFACRAADKGDYWALRRRMGTHVSNPAWSEKYSLESCDKDMAAGNGKSASVSMAFAKDEPMEVLAGVRLGMTPDQVVAQKGAPQRQEGDVFVYDPDPAHKSVLSVTFSSGATRSERKVRVVEFSGEAASAPTELPFYKDMSPVAVLSTLGKQTSGNLTTGNMTFTFKNGVFVRSHDEVVNSYGIYAPDSGKP